MLYEKIDGSTIKVTKEVETNQVDTNYDYDFLKQQEVDILKSKNDHIEARDLELADVRVLIAKCDELEIKSKVAVDLEVEKAK